MQYSIWYLTILFSYVSIGIAVFIILFFISAPYGRHIRSSWGPGIDKRIGWIIMEVVSPIVFVFFFLSGNWREGVLPFVFLGLWLGHYGYRTFFFSPFLKGTVPMSMVVILLCKMFNTANGYLQGRYLYTFSPGAGKYSVDWLYSPQWIVGIVLFISGFIMHVHADTITRKLRTNMNNDYTMPYKGMFIYVSAPNYLGEIIQWWGWAILTWSIPGVAFAFWTMANLVPRAVANHNWYKKRFSDYPDNRKALIPFLF